MSFPARLTLALAVAAAPITAAPVAAQSAPAAAPAPVLAPVQAPVLTPFKASGRYFFAAADGGLYVRPGLGAKARAVLPAGSYGTLAPSPDGKRLAYATPASASVSGDATLGSRVRIRDLDKGTDLGDVLEHAVISRAPWTHNNRGFFYARVDTTDGRQRVYYHKVGTPQARDQIMLSRPDFPDWRYDARVSDDGQYLVITIAHPVDDHTRLYFVDLDDAERPKLNAPVVKLIDAFGARYEFVDNGGASFFLWTDRGAPTGRLVLANTEVIREARWPAVIAASTDTLQLARTAGDQYVIVVHRNDTSTVARVYTPPDEGVLRDEARQRMDSLRKARAARRGDDDDDDDPPPPPPGLPGARARQEDLLGFRLDLRRQIPLPKGATIIDMRSVADDPELFYTVRLRDGSTKSFIYDVKTGEHAAFDTRTQ